jgi:hypothetical protein
MLCDVSGHLHHRAEMGRALDPPHLNCRWNHNPTWLPRSLRENVSKVVAVGFLDNETLESATDVELREQNVQPRWCVLHIMQQSREHLPNLLSWDVRS